MAIFTQATYYQNLLAVVVVIAERNTSISITLANLGRHGKTYIFADYNQAEAFIHKLLG